MVPSFTFDLSCPGWQNHSPSYNFTIHTSGSNHKPLKSVAHESSQTMAVGNTSGVWICWARDNENCASAPAVTRTSCASNWFRGRWRGNVKFYYLTHLSWFMIVTARGEAPHCPLTGGRCWSSRCPSRSGLAGGSGSGRRMPGKGDTY